MKSLGYLFLRILGASSLCGLAMIATPSQRLENETWGCGLKDYKCQLDDRMKALQTDPKDPENYYDIGVVFQRSGNCDEAVESFSMYIGVPGLKPQLQADGYNNRGICQRRLGKPDLAYDDHSKAIALVGNKPDFFVNRGNDLTDMGKGEAAVVDYSKAISLDAKFALAYSNRGRYYLAANKLEAALADLNKAIELNPSNAEPFYTRAMVYRGKSDFKNAIPDLDRYIALNPGAPRYLADGYVNRAIAYASIGKMEPALADASKAIELATDYYDAYKVRAYIYRALKKDDLANADEANASRLKH